MADPDDYDLSTYSRMTEEPTDRCGRMARGSLTLMRLATDKGAFWIPYHGICGIDECPEGFTLHFRATLGWEGRAMEGCWTAEVKGKNLDGILNHIGAHTRAALNPGGTPHSKDAFVSSIRLEPVETAVFEASG